MIHKHTVPLNIRVSPPLKEFLRKFNEDNNLKSWKAFILFAAQQNGYKVQPNDM